MRAQTQSQAGDASQLHLGAALTQLGDPSQLGGLSQLHLGGFTQDALGGASQGMGLRFRADGASSFQGFTQEHTQPDYGASESLGPGIK